MQLVVRVMFHKDAADSDSNVRLAPGVRAAGRDGGSYFPVGTLENGLLYANKVDDFLFDQRQAREDRGADFVFFVNGKDLLVEPPAGKEIKPTKVKDGVFVEVKRLVKVDLAGKEVPVGVKPDKTVHVERKPEVSKKKGAGGAAPAGTAAPPRPRARRRIRRSSSATSQVSKRHLQPDQRRHAREGRQRPPDHLGHALAPELAVHGAEHPADAVAPGAQDRRVGDRRALRARRDEDGPGARQAPDRRRRPLGVGLDAQLDVDRCRRQDLRPQRRLGAACSRSRRSG